MNTLRPNRLLAAWPELRPVLRELSPFVNSNCSTDIAQVQASTHRLNLIYNTWLATLPVERRPRTTRTFFDIHDELGRNASFFRFGRQSFVIGDDVLADLGRSDADEVRVDDLKFPYPCFFVGFESESQKIGECSFEGILVRVGHMLGVTLFGRSIAEPTRVNFGTAYTVEFPLGQGLRIAEGFQNYLDAMHSRVTDLVAEMDGIESQAKVDGLSVRRAAILAAEAQATDFQTHRESLSVALSLAANVLCLLGSPHDDLLGPYEWLPSPGFHVTKKQKKAAIEAGALEVRTLRFGRTVAQAGQNGHDGRSPRAHWRRGHFRRQQSGPRSQPQWAVRWIRPVLVNSTAGGVAEETIYEVGGL